MLDIFTPGLWGCLKPGDGAFSTVNFNLACIELFDLIVEFHEHPELATVDKGIS